MRKHAARTDPGKKRNHNEDALLTLPDTSVFVVADGVGGRACGEVASAICVESFRESAEPVARKVAAYDDNPSIDTRNAVLAAID